MESFQFYVALWPAGLWPIARDYTVYLVSRAIVYITVFLLALTLPYERLLPGRGLVEVEQSVDRREYNDRVRIIRLNNYY